MLLVRTTKDQCYLKFILETQFESEFCYDMLHQNSTMKKALVECLIKNELLSEECKKCLISIHFSKVTNYKGSLNTLSTHHWRIIHSEDFVDDYHSCLIDEFTKEFEPTLLRTLPKVKLVIKL